MTTESIATAVRESFDTSTPLRITGGESWLDAGRPVRAERKLSLRADSGITAYIPEDLTITMRAGTALADIEATTRQRGQWLPLDPYGSQAGSIGATVATASAGPLSSSFGLARDLVLGLEFVNGRGEVVRAGGKVVKNVAGFDLSRLLTGSWGSLGVITEITMRLYALPEVDRTFAITLSGSEKETTALLRAMTIAPLSPYAFLLLSASIARALELGENRIGLMRLGGNSASVKAQAAAVSHIVNVEEIDTTTWPRLRQLETGSHTALRISSLPQRIAGAAARILNDDIPGVYTSIDPRRGLIRVVAGQAEGAGVSHDFATGVVQSDASELVFEKLPTDLWSVVAPSVVGDPLSQGIKRAYDPHNILNPGILGELN